MNKELVKQLYYQASSMCKGGVAWEFEELFAELIVDEVINAVSNSDLDNPIPDIRLHFGLSDQSQFLKPIGA